MKISEVLCEEMGLKNEKIYESPEEILEQLVETLFRILLSKHLHPLRNSSVIYNSE
jgi:hypothetical protein